MKNHLREEKGVTLVTLGIVIVILVIITNLLLYNTKDSVIIKKLEDLYIDVDNLREKVSNFYNQYGKIPASTEYTNISHLSEVLSQKNDTGKFYVLDLQAMENISLNYGKEYEQIRQIQETAKKNGVEVNQTEVNSYTDLYIINENSHNIFYVKGIEITQKDQEAKQKVTKVYYTDKTVPDETKVDLRYRDGILIPEGYYFLGKEEERIVISKNQEEIINSTSDTQYIWTKQVTKIDQLPEGVSLDNTQNENEFIKSTNYYQGYFRNKNKSSTIDVIYLPIQEKQWSEVYTKTTQYIDPEGKIAYIPAGFRVSLAEGSNLIKNGLVITDKIDEDNNSIGNEFIWIPIDTNTVGTNFKRTEGYSNNVLQNILDNCAEAGSNGTNPKIIESDTTKAEAKAMYASVKEKGGFYVGRYEAGKDDAGNVICKKGVTVYNNIPWSESNSMSMDTAGAVQKAREFANQQGYTSAKSTLCYGVQWDATLNFIDSNYLTNQLDNQSNCTENSYVRNSTGKGNYQEEQNTNNWKGSLAKTGQAEQYAIKNIYDMAGNVAEWTMENDEETRIVRGGSYSNMGVEWTSSSRGNNNQTLQDPRIGFRICLYL